MQRIQASIGAVAVVLTLMGASLANAAGPAEARVDRTSPAAMAASSTEVPEAVLATRLLDIAAGQGGGDAFVRAVAVADAVLAAIPGRRLSTLDSVPAASPVTRAEPAPLLSEAVAWFEAALGGDADAARRAARAAGLDDAPEPVQAALVRLFAAFLAYDRATATALAAVPAPLREAAMVHPTNDARAALLQAGAHGPEAARAMAAAWAPVDEARRPLLSAMLELRDAFAALERPSEAQPGAPRAPTLHRPPFLTLDLAGEDSTHTDAVMLLVDVGGDDTYLNNAGGSSALAGQGGDKRGGAAAAFDLAGNDRYGDGFRDAVNGGGWFGAGMLVDAAGDDTYLGHDASNGGSMMGSGFLLDAEGHDTYLAGEGTNGGGFYGAGMLVDGAGDDHYEGSHFTNGGGVLGPGRLVDLGGHDTYLAQDAATNGGAGAFGQGFLVDLDGDDHYRVWVPAYENLPGRLGGLGVNGGAALNGRGFLLDGEGHDTYEAADRGVNGGTWGGTHALLWDRAGDDTYLGGADGANGGAGAFFDLQEGHLPGAAGLLDGAGSDTFTDAQGRCTNPAPCTVAPKGIAGFLLDL